MKTTSQYNTVKGLNKALRSLPKEATVQLREASRDIATFVADEARDRAVRVGGVAVYVAPTIRSTRDRVPVVRMGGTNKLPSNTRNRLGGRQTVGDVAFGAEFGGRGRPTTQQFQPHRGTQGYFLWPTIRARSDDIQERYSEALLDALGRI